MVRGGYNGGGGGGGGSGSDTELAKSLSRSASFVLCFFFFWSSFSFYTLPILPVTSLPNNLNKWSGLKILKLTARISVGTVPPEKRGGYCRMTLRKKNHIIES